MPEHGRGLPRLVEVSLAALGLVIVAPVIVVSAVLIAIGSPGPVLFRQRRCGRRGLVFTLYKLRTMRDEEPGPRFSYTGDPRVTPIGRFLRKAKIDELPELWNVIKGDLSLVGPRPEVPDFIDTRDPRWQTVLLDRPGLTHPVTLRLRNAEDLLARVGPERARYYTDHLMPYKLSGYLDYRARRTWLTDLEVIARTVVVVLLPWSAPAPSAGEVIEAKEGAR